MVSNDQTEADRPSQASDQLKWERHDKSGIRGIAGKYSNQTKSESERVLEAVADVIKQALQRGEKLDLRGLGVFKVRETKPRQARNPRTGEALSIPAKKAAVFKPGKELSALLNTSAEEPDAQAKAVEQPV